MKQIKLMSIVPRTPSSPFNEHQYQQHEQQQQQQQQQRSTQIGTISNSSSRVSISNSSSSSSSNSSRGSSKNQNDSDRLQQQQRPEQYIQSESRGYDSEAKTMQSVVSAGHGLKQISPPSTILGHADPTFMNCLLTKNHPLSTNCPQEVVVLPRTDEVFEIRIKTLQEETRTDSMKVNEGNGLMAMNRSRSLFSLTANSSCSNGQGHERSTSGTTTASTSSELTADETGSPCSNSREDQHESKHEEFRRRFLEDAECSLAFGRDLKRCTNSSPEVPAFDRAMRESIEPHVHAARYWRQQHSISFSMSRLEDSSTAIHSSIVNSVGVPYTRLRNERRFLFDVDTYPLHEILAKTLGVKDLTQIHNVIRSQEQRAIEDDGKVADLKQLLAPLLTRTGRRRFQEAYDNFVTSFCIPLLHSFAISSDIFHHRTMDACTNSSSDAVFYRYQAFPSLRILRPGDEASASAPHSDCSKGHSIGSLVFHIPLTPAFGTNALYTESYPGREDWHPLSAKSGGLGYLFDGARCLHFNMENTTDATSVSLDFRVAIHRDDSTSCGVRGYGGDGETTATLTTSSTCSTTSSVDGDGLCNREILEDDYSRAGPGYYDEAFIDTRSSSSHAWQTVAKKCGCGLLDPDYRVGFPFA